MKKINIGLFGFGVVGEGIFNVLADQPDLGLHITHIVIKDPNKPRNAKAELFSTDPNTILDNDQIDVVVELIDDSESAFQLVAAAMKKGKSVVSGNKKMIAENLETLLQLQEENKVSFLYEAAVCGSIPIIRNLEEYFDNDLLNYVKGIVNGSTNYILSQMAESSLSYEEALDLAKKYGFAESNPKMDVEGFDAAYKLIIITLHAFGHIIKEDQIYRKGITALSAFDFQYAKEKTLHIKLVANSSISTSGTIEKLSVFPTFVENSNAMSSTKNEYNGVLIGSNLSDEQFLKGKGAGRYPTSSAVLSDLSALKYDYKYSLKKGAQVFHSSSTDNTEQKVFISSKTLNNFPKELFSELEESFSGPEMKYQIGQTSLKKLKQFKLLDNSDFSIILFN